MTSDSDRTVKKIPVRRMALLVAVAWTTVLGGSLAWNLWQEDQAVMNQARSEARANFDKDTAYRRWNTLHGGVYVPVTEHTPANPYLSMLPERDITTTSGRRLTLLNPAYMTRQVQELSRLQYGIQGHLTSLQSIRPGNEPDRWEAKALLAFQEGANEISAIEEMDGIPYLRVMWPFIAEAGCLKCHGHQGYKVGDVRGGISVSVPLDRYYALRRAMSFGLAIWHLLIYLFGLAVIFFGARLLNTRVGENEKISRELAFDRKRVQSLLALSDVKVSTEEELVEFALEEVIRLTGSEVGYFHFYDEMSRTIKLFVWSRKVLASCRVADEMRQYPLEKSGVWGDCIRMRKPVVHNDYASVPDKKGLPEGHLPITRHMSVPVMDGDQIVAMAGVGNKVKPYDDGDVAQLTLYMGKAWDIIKDRRSRIELKEQEAGLLLFRNLIDQAHDAIFIVSPEDGHFLDVNGRACEVLGYQREELLRLGVMDIDVGLPANFSWAAHIEELRRKPALLLESVHQRKDGTTFPVEVNIRIIAQENDEYMISNARDITARKATEKELEDHRLNLEKLVKERTGFLEQKTGELEQSQQALQYLLEDVNEAKQELEAKLAEIERMNKVFVDRELKMVELKEEIKVLKGQKEKGPGDEAQGT